MLVLQSNAKFVNTGWNVAQIGGSTFLLPSSDNSWTTQYQGQATESPVPMPLQKEF